VDLSWGKIKALALNKVGSFGEQIKLNVVTIELRVFQKFKCLEDLI
jgi:hypothetical protein